MSDNTPAKTRSEVHLGSDRLGKCLYRKGQSIYARVRKNGKLTWRSTGTNEPAKARAWLKKWTSEEWMEEHGIEANGVILHRQRVTVSELIDAYVQAGFPKCKRGSRGVKTDATIKSEKACLKPIGAFFGARQAAALNLGDCDTFKDWRLSGGFIVSQQGELNEEQKTAKLKLARLKKGTRSVDLELTILSNVLNLAVKRAVLKLNPLKGRGLYSSSEDIRHCREVAPTPQSLSAIEYWLRKRNEHGVADVVCFLAYSGLRIGEALPLDWEAVNWAERVLHVRREKKGVTPWVPILSEMESLLRGMKARSQSFLLFPSPFKPEVARDSSAVRHRLTAACKALGLSHVTPHGLRSYFVTQARQSGLTDAEIAALIGDKTGPAIIAKTYGDVRDDHLFKQAQRIQLTLATKHEERDAEGSIGSSNMAPRVSGSSTKPADASFPAQTTTA